MTYLSLIIPFISYILFARARLLRYLHILQQDDYDNNRFLRWMFSSFSFDKRLSFAIFVVWGIGYSFSEIDNFVLISFASLLMFGQSLLEVDPRTSAKKKLVLTNRAKRILFLSMCLSLLLAAAISFYLPIWGWVIAIQMVPFLLVLANFLLQPVEQNYRSQFKKEAQDILFEVDPEVVSVTGSFGKTSVKHLVGHVLSLNARTLMTPGSVNTEMGVSRIIREQLKPGTQFFVTEMGAYGRGSIERLCKFTPPDIGIITAIGPAHLERFKTLKNTAKAKFELAEAVFKKESGKMIIHAQAMDYGKDFDFVAENRDKILVVGSTDEADVFILDRIQNNDGIQVNIRWLNNEYILTSPVYGYHHADNMALAFATAMAVGIEPEKAIIALKSAPQIQHRLEVKKHDDNTIYIDDAFNSNPEGFKSAVDLMKQLTPNGSRSILVTPGIVELGKDHDKVHSDLADHVKDKADIVLVVSPNRIPTFVSVLKESQSVDVHEFSTFTDADVWLRSNVVPGDVVLIENDLPDLFNDRLKL